MLYFSRIKRILWQESTTEEWNNQKTTWKLRPDWRQRTGWYLCELCQVSVQSTLKQTVQNLLIVVQKGCFNRQNVDESSSLENNNMSWTVFLFTGWDCWSMLSSPVKCSVWPRDFHLTLTNDILPNQFKVAVCCGKDKRNSTEHLVESISEWALSIFLRGTSAIHAVFRCVF